MAVEFTLEINVQSSTRGGYRDFIQNLRLRLGVRFSHNRPALAVQEERPTRFFDLIIRTNDHSVRFRLRMDNLYLIGYQMESGQWLEFDNGCREHLITEQGANFLGFNGSYQGLQEAAKREMTEIRVGLQALVRAINQLAVTTETMPRARSLIVVIMMICESTRLIPVSNYMANNSDDFIETWIIDLVRSWGALSAALFLADAFPEESFQLRANNIRLPPDNRQIRTIAEAAEILGILLGLCFRPSGPPRRVPRMTFDEGQCSSGFSGLPLLEVFSVRINNIDDEDPGQLYGSITINNGLYTQYIYNRTSDNPESIKPGHYALLTGPSECISAFENFTIKLLLTDKDTLLPDDVIINADISWDAFDIGNVYDKLISKKLDSDSGSVTVNYAVLRHAVAARLTVTLEEGGETTTNVYGQVSAHYDNWEDHETTCLLFNRARNDYVDVRHQQNIPLLRSVVAVPLNNSLKVTAYLLDHDTVTSDDKIANGTVEFPVPEEIPGVSFKDIYGEDGNWVRVRVDWSFGL